MPNIFEKRIAEWERQYGGLSPEVQRKIDKLVEQYDQKQQLDKNSKVFSIADGARLIREFKGRFIGTRSLSQRRSSARTLFFRSGRNPQSPLS